MRKGKSKKTREWGPEAFIEWMLKSKNVSKGNIKLLLESRDDISHAWDRDDHGTKGFPMNTSHLLYEIEMTLKGWRSRRRKGSWAYAVATLLFGLGVVFVLVLGIFVFRRTERNFADIA